MTRDATKRLILLALTDEQPLSFSQLSKKVTCYHCDEVPENFRSVFQEMLFVDETLRVDGYLKVAIREPTT